MNQSEHPWMEHAATGHRAQLPDLPYWRAHGWEPCDGPPPEPDLTRDHEPETPAEPGFFHAPAPDEAPAEPVKPNRKNAATAESKESTNG